MPTTSPHSIIALVVGGVVSHVFPSTPSILALARGGPMRCHVTHPIETHVSHWRWVFWLPY